MKWLVRNLAEFATIFLLWGALQPFIGSYSQAPLALTVVVLGLAWIKTIFFGCENLQQLWRASLDNVPYHCFMQLMLVNMAQIIVSFALDFHLLHLIDRSSFGEVGTDGNLPETVFEFLYFSVLNFTFFGYGDVTPQTVPAKLLTMTEIVLAFVTVIFLLSDFISLKDSLRTPRDRS
jgi:hypothetical protein